MKYTMAVIALLTFHHKLCEQEALRSLHSKGKKFQRKDTSPEEESQILR